MKRLANGSDEQLRGLRGVGRWSTKEMQSERARQREREREQGKEFVTANTGGNEL